MSFYEAPQELLAFVRMSWRPCAGQGMIMRQRPAFSMLAGAVTAWAVLGPMARRNGWATGEIDSWEDGAQVLPTVFHPAV